MGKIKFLESAYQAISDQLDKLLDQTSEPPQAPVKENGQGISSEAEGEKPGSCVVGSTAGGQLQKDAEPPARQEVEVRAGGASLK